MAVFELIQFFPPSTVIRIFPSVDIALPSRSVVKKTEKIFVSPGVAFNQ
jgi:hypothetical protein